MSSYLIKLLPLRHIVASRTLTMTPLHRLVTPFQPSAVRCIFSLSCHGDHQLLHPDRRVVSMVQLQKRFKGKGKGKASGKEDEESDREDEEESDGDEVEGVDREFEDMEVAVTSMRLDLVAKAFIRYQREEVNENIASGIVRLNGRSCSKNDIVQEFDVIDHIKGRSPKNPEMIDVTRAEILSVPDLATSKGRYRVKGRRWKVKTIENYPEEPFESQRIAERRNDDAE